MLSCLPPAMVTCPPSFYARSVSRGIQSDGGGGSLDRSRMILVRHALNQVSLQDLTRSAVQGMLKAAHDPYGRYLSPRAYDRLLAETEGIFVGIGVEIRAQDGRIVLDLVPGGPAAQAGLEAGSVLVAVDGHPIKANTPEAAQDALEGPAGAVVRVSVLERGRPRVYALRRREVLIHAVEAHVLSGRLGYLCIREFSRGSGEEAAHAAQRLVREGIQGWVLDLRSNPGGFLNEALAFLNGVARPGASARIDYRDRTDQVAHAPGPGLRVPMVVLVNAKTASAAELVAVALRDLSGATIIGQRTYGKAYLQEAVPLDGEGGMLFTVARVSDGRGWTWQGRGVTPDVGIYDRRDVLAWAVERLRRTQSRRDQGRGFLIPGL